MSEQRRDDKGHILHPGELQRSDGRYSFTYFDSTGKRKYLYSNRLMKTDKVPEGCKKDLSLREKEDELRQRMSFGLSDCGGDMTVYELAKKYVSLKPNVRESTKTGYKTVLNIIAKDPFGAKRIDKVMPSDAKAWLIRLQQEDKRGYSTIHTIRGVVRPAFQMAVEDNLLMRNPFNFEAHTVLVNDSKTRNALTGKQEHNFLEFVRNDSHFCRYYEGFYILFNTGLRISEFCALTPADVDFKKRCIHVTGQLVRYSNMLVTIQEPKTAAGVRDVPMSDEVMECFRTVMKNRKPLQIEPIIDGKTGFLFIDKEGHPTVAQHWQNFFRHAVQKYNSIYRVQLPDISPHICRHTFCSKMAKSGMNPKSLQYIMGHSDISVTMNTYTHIDFDDAQEEYLRLFGKNHKVGKLEAAE